MASKINARDQNRTAKLINVATLINKDGDIFQFERECGEFEISKEKVDIQSPFAWSELWKIIYLKEYNKKTLRTFRTRGF